MAEDRGLVVEVDSAGAPSCSLCVGAHSIRRDFARSLIPHENPKTLVGRVELLRRSLPEREGHKMCYTATNGNARKTLTRTTGT